jgi:glycerol kinase
MQFQADILGANVQRPAVIETTALGAAYLAGLFVGLYKKEDIANNRTVDKTFNPSMDEVKRAGLYKGWKKAVECTLMFNF